MDHIEEAVACALNPSADLALKQQATQYCEQVKASPDGWQSCLALFVREPKSAPETRLFCLQVIEEVLMFRINTLDESRIHYLRQTFMEYIRREFVKDGVNNTLSSEPPYLKNKFAHSVALLFRQTYLKSWPTFFTEMLSMIAPLPNTAGKSNMRMVDLFLRVLMSIDEEVVNTLTHRTMTKEENALNIDIKDRMREQDVPQLAAAWYELLAEYKDRSPEFAEFLLRIVGVYVAWIDITLIVNEKFVSLIYGFLNTPMRSAAAECLTDVIKKGMKPLDKLELISILSVVNVLQQIDISTDSEFRERVARLVNNLGLQLCQIWQDTNPQTNPAYPATAQQTAYSHISQLIPILLRFLSDEDDNISGAVFGFLREVLNMFKTIKKATGSLPQEQKAFLRQLLEAIVIKMKYGEDMDWVCVAIAGGSESVGAVGEDSIDDEEMLNFLEMRRELKRFYDLISALSASLTTSFLHAAVTTTLGTYVNEKANGAAAAGGVVPASSSSSSSSSSLNWRDLELALYLLYLYGEAIKGAPQFIVGAVGANGGRSAGVTQSAESSGPLTPLGECLYEMCKSGVSAFPHPSVSANFFEIVCRYSNFFEVRPDCIPEALEAFVDARGLHHANPANRARAWYLFWRFSKDLKQKLARYVETVLTNIQDVLTTEASLPPVLGPDFDLATNKDAMFETKTYVFEAVGLLISQESIPAQKQFEYLSVVVSPFLSIIQENLTACQAIRRSNVGIVGGNVPVDAKSLVYQELMLVWSLHHRLLALGSIAKGFPDVTTKKITSSSGGGGATVVGGSPYSPVFKQVAEMTLVGLETLSRFEVIRSAARFTFGRLISCMGQDVQPYIPTLIRYLLQECSMTELIDFLPFMSQMAHKFRSTNIWPVLNEVLFPLVQKVFMFLNQSATGTDEAVALVELRKAYLAFLQGLFSSEMEDVLSSEVNAPHFSLILQSVLHYALDTSNIQVCKSAFGLLLRMVQSWGGQGETNATTSPSLSSAELSAGFTSLSQSNLDLSSLKANSNNNNNINTNNHSNGHGGDNTSSCTGNNNNSSNSRKREAPGFYQFMYEHILRATFEAPMKANFDLADGQSMMVVGEITNIQKTILAKQGQTLLQFLGHVYLPAIHCPPELAQEYCQALQQLDVKQFRKYFQAFIYKSRS
ncbi:pre-tRNA nuclear export protein [Actinomortierella ambigua]|uniref:Exportin-T n=1 Tax=Actinomortierella ambigua TaxID=1343610 RepID=A0A9P6PWN5_9FUNG|nr:pre-tRNA nuclear export protein [Actinomortierella ambigua]